MIRAGEFVSQLHVGALMLAELNGLIELPRLASRRAALGRESRDEAQSTRQVAARTACSRPVVPVGDHAVEHAFNRIADR